MGSSSAPKDASGKIEYLHNGPDTNIIATFFDATDFGVQKSELSVALTFCNYYTICLDEVRLY